MSFGPINIHNARKDFQIKVEEYDNFSGHPDRKLIHGSNLHVNKRKFKHESLDLPNPKHACLEKSFSPETCFPSNFQSDVDDIRKEMSFNKDNIHSKYDQLGQGSGKDSNSFSEDEDSVMSASNNELQICQYDQRSSSSVKCACRSVNSVDRSETNTCDDVSMNLDYLSSNFEEQQLDCLDIGVSCSDNEISKIKQLEDEALGELFCSNDVVSNNFILSSGRWDVNQVEG